MDLLCRIGSLYEGRFEDCMKSRPVNFRVSHREVKGSEIDCRMQMVMHANLRTLDLQ